MNERKLVRLATAFAISNLGHKVPDRIASLDDGDWSIHVQESMCNLSGHLMESDEHEDIFVGEAESWYNDLKSRSEEEILRIWSHNDWIKKILDVDDSVLDEMSKRSPWRR